MSRPSSIPRKRLSLSFSDGHRLSAAFKAAGIESMPGARDVRELMKLGLAAKAVGLVAIEGRDGCFRLARAIDALSDSHGVADSLVVDREVSTALYAEDAEQRPSKMGTEKHEGVSGESDSAADRAASPEHTAEHGSVTLADDSEGHHSEIDQGTRTLLARALQF